MLTVDDDVVGVVAGGRWYLRRAATLTIDRSNDGPDIGGADCSCHDVAGFELDLDAMTGDVLEYTPGIDCVAHPRSMTLTRRRGCRPASNG